MKRNGGRAARLGVGLAVGGLIGMLVLELEIAGLVSFWGDGSYIAVILTAVCAVLWLTPLRRLVAAAAILLGATWLAAAYTPLTLSLRSGLGRRQAPAAADAVFVFGSSLQPDGEPTSEAMTRLMRGLQLVASGYSGRLVVSEQRGEREYAAVAREWARAFAPKAEIIAIGPIANTHDEGVAVGRLFRERGWHRVLAVTSPAHTRRAAGVLERAGLQVIAVPSVETRYDFERLSRPRDRLNGFTALLHEHLGLIVYQRRGWIR